MTAFHAGEMAIQRRAGFGESVVSVGARFIRDAMPEQHQQFFAQLPFAVIGVIDAQGHPRAGLLAGAPGFLHAADERHLTAHGYTVVGEGIAEGMVPGAPLGMLGIEAATRRRNRLNGTVVDAQNETLHLAVSQSFGNCPKYITPRHATWAPENARSAPTANGWDEAARRIVAGADTFFIASAHPEAGVSAVAAYGVDVSHRGGEAGFVKVNGSSLSVPDYPGNRFFNTLGNLELNPLAGLLFIDFAQSQILQLAVRARLEWLPPRPEAPDRPERLLHFDVLRTERSSGALPLLWADA